ncbi:uncharacterized protein PHALS_00458 [Plasmopara halstedii]|uniref:Uncharacterized protein n=1 Tax=Plasmopara halstedii TaxID=4781 RepID=A0A0P1A6U1_PLAHL|nr:uncharacterized protein PHALS_00458 [Plasmopara halstedii]CEG36140.1 hypothetical protein PHALS_00458 [Plasmopara halstedii]|eukprot:XP_024572509.1 hypothetical protein PHALS_00458 [Plasmopara halstedii]
MQDNHCQRSEGPRLRLDQLVLPNVTGPTAYYLLALNLQGNDLGVAEKKVYK